MCGSRCDIAFPSARLDKNVVSIVGAWSLICVHLGPKSRAASVRPRHLHGGLMACICAFGEADVRSGRVLVMRDDILRTVGVVMCLNCAPPVRAEIRLTP